MSRPFRFKEFSIRQDHAAMKVGTDSVLLGSWVSIVSPKNILDIGCGTGLLSIMMAQRFNDAQITGIEIESEALIDAKFNVDQSKWKDRIQLLNKDILEFKSEREFDLIITNPPYFPNDTLAPDQKRALARSGENYSLVDWIISASKLLSSSGKIAFILPVNLWMNIEDSLLEWGLVVSRICKVRPIQQKPVHRVIIELQHSNNRHEQIIEELTIEKSKRHEYTDEYIALTRTFYLAMP